jgi:arabinogalactan oligomer/maltooligosaccharide transport system permease protein
MRRGGTARVALTLSGLVGLLVGASPASIARAQPEPVVLWHAYGEAEARGLRAALDAFEREHPDVRVTVVHNAFGAYASKLESAIPTGHGPDLFLDAHERLVTYVEAGLVEPFGEPGLEARLDLDAAHLEALSVDGALYGLPLALKCAALYVNTDLARTPPETLEAIAAMRERVPDDVFPLVLEAENPYYDAALLHAFGGRFLDDAGHYAFEGDAAERTLDTLLALTRARVVPEEPSGDLVKQLFAGGRAATAISGPWLAPDLTGARFSWTVVPLPRVEAAGGRPMEPFVTIEGAFLAKGTPRAAGARRLALFLAGREGAVLRADDGGQIVASRTAWQDPRLADDAFLRTFREAASRGRPMPTHPKMRMVWEPALRAIRKVLRGDTPAREALVEAGHRFEDVTRPPPPPRNPTIALVLAGLALLLGAFVLVRKGRDAQLRAEIRASMPAYKYVAHAAVAVGLLVVAPLVVGALTSFFAGRGTDLYYVGLANYLDIITARGGDLFGHGSFWLVLLVTVAWTVVNVALHVVIGVALALVLNRPTQALKAPYRVLLILPWAVPNYVTALSWKGMFHRQLGAVNAILEALGAEPVSWFGQFATAFSANVATNVWLGFPFMMVVTLGALTAIPKDLYEAAAVDGASALQRFRLITAPMLKPMLAPAVAMGSIWTFNMFNVVFLVSGGEPDGTTEILVSEAYRWAFTRGAQYGYASAYAVLIFGILYLVTRRASGRLEGAGGTT